MSIPENLLKALYTKRVVPFIGAGFSYYFGNPSWNDLLLCIAEDEKINIHLEKEGIKNKDPLQVAEAIWQFYKNRNYSEYKVEMEKSYSNYDNADIEFRDFIHSKVLNRLMINFNNIVLKCVKNNTNTDNIKNTSIENLKLLNNYSFNTIVTTNYDKNIENEIFKDIDIIYPGIGKELSINEKNNILYKIHGDIDEPNSLILTQSQYYNFMHNLGFYKSKLYTIFATNIILMIGYSFRDINVHEIYFQFRRDYENLISKSGDENPKAYLVLTSYDKNNLGKYYELHKEFLNGCGIVVIDEGFDELPEFIELLDNEMKAYQKRLSIGETVSNANLAEIKQIIGKVLKNDTTYVIDNKIVEDYMRVIIQILLNPSKLIELEFEIPFDYTAALPEEIGLYIFDSIIKCAKDYKRILSTSEYSKILLLSLNFADDSRYMINDFYHYPGRFEKFIELCKGVKNLKLDTEDENKFAELFAESLRYSGWDVGRCYGSAEILKENINNISQGMFEVYFRSKENLVENQKDHKPAISNNELKWMKIFMEDSKYSDELKERIDKFISLDDDRWLRCYP